MTTASDNFTTRLLINAGVSTGMRVLDVGCGTGDLAFLAAGLVGPCGEVIGIDQDDRPLNVAQSRASAYQRGTPSFMQGELLALPKSLGFFDAIVGRRVLMYQTNAIAVITALSAHLAPGGVMVFQEHDTTMAPASLDSFVLHKQAQGWIREMIAREGADLHIGFNLHNIFTKAGLGVGGLHAECIVQTPDAAYGLGDIVQACLPRILALGVASSDEVGMSTLHQRLDEERTQSEGIYIGDVMFGAWGRMLTQ